MMTTNEKYDSYLLYEYMKKVSFTVIKTAYVYD